MDIFTILMSDVFLLQQIFVPIGQNALKKAVKCNQGMVWHEMEDDFSIFHTGNFLPFYFHSILKIFHARFHSKLKFSSIFQTKEILDWKQCNAYFVALHLWNVVSNHSWRCANNTMMPRPVSGIHNAHGLMHRCSLDFELGGGINRKSCNDVIRSCWKEGLFMGQRMKGQKLGVWFGS